IRTVDLESNGTATIFVLVLAVKTTKARQSQPNNPGLQKLLPMNTGNPPPPKFCSSPSAKNPSRRTPPAPSCPKRRHARDHQSVPAECPRFDRSPPRRAWHREIRANPSASG